MEKILVTRSSMPPMDEFVKEIQELWNTHWLTNMGEKHKILQNNIKEYLNVPNIDLLTNGHMALELSLQALQLNGEVITTPFTFASTIHAIVRNGLKPVFCDVNPRNYTIDVKKIEQLITPNTVAILPVHVYGNICDVEEIDRIAKKHNLKVVYDAAHAFGETYKGIGVGNFGDVSCFSFHATKVFNTIEGGAVCFSDEGFGSRIYDLKNFGIHGPESVEAVGANAKMNEFCAAMGICNLRYIDREIDKRELITKRYIEKLENIEGLRINRIQPEVKSNYSYFPIFIESDAFGVNRDYVHEELEKENIYTRKYFYPLANEYQCYKSFYSAQETPIALKISREVLTLPLYSDLDMEIVDRICNLIISMRK